MLDLPYATTSFGVLAANDEREARRLGADELMLLNLGHSPAAIHRSTDIIADAYGMPEHHPDQDEARYR